MTINNNYQYDNNSYSNNTNNTNKTLNKIAAGIELNKASDNASALSIYTQLNADSNSFGKAVENTNNGIAMMNIADGAMNEQSKILDEINQKMLQASTSTTSNEGREAILKDVQALMKNFDNIASQTNYNGQSLLQQSANDTTPSNSFNFQIGIDGSDNLNTQSIHSNSQGLNLESIQNFSAENFTASDASNFLSNISDAMTQLNNYRSEVASSSNQLESANRNIVQQMINTSAAASEIGATDYARESSNFSKQNLFSQIGSYTVSQANVNQQTVLRLLT